MSAAERRQRSSGVRSGEIWGISFREWVGRHRARWRCNLAPTTQQREAAREQEVDHRPQTLRPLLGTAERRPRPVKAPYQGAHLAAPAGQIEFPGLPFLIKALVGIERSPEPASKFLISTTSPGEHFLGCCPARIRNAQIAAAQQGLGQRGATPRKLNEEGGLACLEQALRVAREQQAKSLESRAVISLARLWGEQGRRAGPQKRDHGRAGRKSASQPSQWRVSTASNGASALRPLTIATKATPSGGSLYRTRRNLRSPSVKVQVAAGSRQ